MVGKRTGRPLGITQDAGFAAQTGYPTVDNTEINVPIGYLVNPGSVCYVACPNCNMEVHIRKKFEYVVLGLLRNVVQW